MSGAPGVALQLFSVRQDMKTDYVGTLRRVAETGYRAIEFGGVPSGKYGDMPAAELRRVLDDLGIRAISAHVGQTALEEDLEAEVEHNLALGNRDLICDSLNRPLRADEDGFHRGAAMLERVGKRCAELGARLGYHAHAFELQRFGGKTGLEILLEETDPGRVAWQADVYWLTHGNEDPAEWIGRYADRVRLLHLKDMKHVPPNPNAARECVDDLRALHSTEIGEGRIALGPALAAATSAEWLIVEQDFADGPIFDSIALSLRRLGEKGYP